MKVYELPEEQKIYTLELSNKREYTINGKEKEVIMNSKSQFIELKTGEVINKSFMISITLDKVGTTDQWRSLKARNDIKELEENKK